MKLSGYATILALCLALRPSLAWTQDPPADPWGASGTYVDAKGHAILTIDYDADAKKYRIHHSPDGLTPQQEISVLSATQGNPENELPNKFEVRLSGNALATVTTSAGGYYTQAQLIRTGNATTRFIFWGDANASVLYPDVFDRGAVGAFIDWSSREVLLIQRGLADTYEVFYSNGKKPFASLVALGADAQKGEIRFRFNNSPAQYRIVFEAGDLINSYTCYNPDGTRQTFGQLAGQEASPESDVPSLIKEHEEGGVAKPAIYLYTPKPTEVTLRVNYQAGPLGATYPVHGVSGWQVTATPSGQITDHATGRSHPYLFWEAPNPGSWTPHTTPAHTFSINRTDLSSFLERLADSLGLNNTEAHDLVVYWAPRLNEFPAYRVSVAVSSKGLYPKATNAAGRAYDQLAPLDVSPVPDVRWRLLLMFQGLDQPATAPQPIAVRHLRLLRYGFTLVEWGGMVLPSTGL